VTLKDASVAITKNGADYIIALRSSSGKLIDSTSDVELKSDMPDSYDFMKALWAAAKRSALGTDDVIRRVLDELE
jgi:hypothetical protein